MKYLGKFYSFLNNYRLIYNYLKSSLFNEAGFFSNNRSKDYENYLNHQMSKTLDPKRIKKWKNEEWQIKLNGFKDIFNRNKQFLKDKNTAICLGARTGQEVKALSDFGLEAIGIDLVPFPPYTIKGDIHNLDFPDNSFDFVFTNIFDHALYPDKFCQEMERVCTPQGIIIIHLQIGLNGDEYTETIVYNPNKVLTQFKSVHPLESRKISNTFDSMNWELILRKL